MLRAQSGVLPLVFALVIWGPKPLRAQTQSQDGAVSSEGGGVVGAALGIFRGLESMHLHPRPGSLGSRSLPALTLRWDGEHPVFLEGGASLRGYTRARAGLAFGDPSAGAELSASHHVMKQPHFWGIGPDSDSDDRSDFALTRREVTGNAWRSVGGFLLIAVGGGWVANDIGRGHDGKRPDLQDVFAPDLPFGVLKATQFAHGGVGVDVDLLSVDVHEQQRGGRLRLGWAFFHGVGSTDAAFQSVSADLGVHFPLSARHALSLRASATDHFAVTGSGVPFFALASLGDRDGLRGYREHRFRDRAVLAGGAEWRSRLWSPAGEAPLGVDGFAFLDRGAVGRSLGAIESEDFLTTLGFGARLLRGGIGIVEGFVAFPKKGAQFGMSFGSTF